MKTTLKDVTVLYSKRFKMEGNSGSYFYCLGEKVSEENCEGHEIMKVLGSHDQMDAARGQLPGKFDLDVEMTSGGKDKMVIKLVAMRSLEQPKPSKAAA